MEVKKLMLKRMLRGVSCKHVCVCAPNQRNATVQCMHSAGGSCCNNEKEVTLHMLTVELHVRTPYNVV